MATQPGAADLRGENISKVVTVLGAKKFRLMPLLKMIKSSNMTETYFEEDATILTASGTRDIKGIGKFSEFPTVNRAWTKVSSDHVKYGAESEIAIEDMRLGAFNMQARTVDGIAEAITSRIDTAIYAALTAATGTSGVVAAVAGWDAAVATNQNPINDILRGIQAMDENNYDAQSNGVLLVNPHDYASLMQNSKVVNNVSFKTADIVSNGKMGQVCGLTIVKTTSVVDDEAMILIRDKTAQWQTAIGFESAIIDEPGKKSIFRSWQMGQIQIIHKKALYTITGTEE